MNLHALIHRFAPWICPYCGMKWCVLLLLCGCASERATQRSAIVSQKLQAMAAVEHRAQSVVAPPKQYSLAWDNPNAESYPTEFHATQNLRDWYIYGYAPAGANTLVISTTNACEFFRCRFVLPDGTYSGWNQ